LAFLITDVASKDKKIKETYTTVFSHFIGLVADNLPDEFKTGKRRNISMSVSALLIGSVAIARSIEGEELQKELLKRSKITAMKLIDDC